MFEIGMVGEIKHPNAKPSGYLSNLSKKLWTYLPIRSVSRLTLSPTLRARKLVCRKVNGMIAVEKPSLLQSLTVRLMPSTATDPFDTRKDARRAGARKVKIVNSPCFLM